MTEYSPDTTLEPSVFWAEIDRIGNQFFRIEFWKRNGELRRATGRLNVVSRRTGSLQDFHQRTERMRQSGLCPFIDVNIDPLTDPSRGWRCTRDDRVVRINNVGADPHQHRRSAQ